MTDNEIIKALEALREEQENGYVTALEFGGKRDEMHEGFLDLLGATVDLISRQKAEIERLQNKLDTVKQKVLETIPLVKDDIKTAKAEAIKEFAERLREYVGDDLYFEEETEFFKEYIDNLVKEMVGDNNG
jgi:hypothetical protein